MQSDESDYPDSTRSFTEVCAKSIGCNTAYGAAVPSGDGLRLARPTCMLCRMCRAKRNNKFGSPSVRKTTASYTVLHEARRCVIHRTYLCSRRI